MDEAMSRRVMLDVALEVLTSVGLANLAALTEVKMVGDGTELTPAEVAKEFKVSPATVRRWGTRGWLKPTRRLPGSAYRRYSRSDLDAFRIRLEAGEFEDAVEVAANRPRVDKSMPQAVPVESSTRDTSPDVDGARRLP